MDSLWFFLNKDMSIAVEKETLVVSGRAMISVLMLQPKFIGLQNKAFKLKIFMLGVGIVWL